MFNYCWTKNDPIDYCTNGMMDHGTEYNVLCIALKRDSYITTDGLPML